MMCDKREKRKYFRTLRKELQDKKADGILAERAIRAFGKYESFFVYLSFGTEAGTEELIKLLLEAGKRVCVPKVDGAVMRSVPYSDKLIPGAFGILEPEGGEETTCEVAVTPLLAADGEGYRLGYGGGYYDRYFAAHPEILRVGLSYEGQFTQDLPHERTDIPLDALVTEERVRIFGKRLFSCGVDE